MPFVHKILYDRAVIPLAWWNYKAKLGNGAVNKTIRGPYTIVNDRMSLDASDRSVAELARPGYRYTFVPCLLMLTILLLEPSY